MKPVTISAIALAVVVPVVAPAQGAFEGTVRGRLNAGAMTIEMEQHTRPNAMRQDLTMGGNRMSVIAERATGRQVMLLHDQKTWADMTAMMKMMASMGRGGPPPAEKPPSLPEFRRTDRVETIAGRECRHYVTTSGGTEIDMCAASGMGVFLPGAPPSGGMGGPPTGPTMPPLPDDAATWMNAFADGFFVLKMEANTPQGKLTWLTLAVEAKSLPDDLFRPPAGYTEMKIPGKGP
jgi:hypothetical protein